MVQAVAIRFCYPWSLIGATGVPLQMLYAKTLPFVCVIVLLSLSTHPLPVQAVDGAPQADEIEALRRQLHDLQMRVERLEKEERDASLSFSKEPDVEPVPGGWRKAHNWNLLKEGMTTYQVEEILGEPERQKTVKKFQFLYYGDGRVSVYLRRVKSWQVPSGVVDEQSM